ncbi:hypothetical protein PIB30_016994 [Stylosanthes scabra]|uniref:Protein kinase domain-containing protein n=1 Tax=Stylosanthes scabra TaxID=79078 RepID=A0ABU6Z721_9FABA|nr:hypothetical protein [Stylosanthes scabra]
MAAYLKSRLKNGIISICILVMSLGCAKSNDGEREYMLKLLNALKPTPSNWSNTTHMCHWTGVTCNDQSGRIEEIDLRDMSLTGTVPSGLNDSLTQLKYLILFNNSLSGPVPALANLTFLETMYLDNNNFNSIPHGCFHALTSLNWLSLTYNTKLPPWNFPTDLTAHSSQLQRLFLEGTNLMGSIPNISQFFPAMERLYLSNNNLSSIPEGCFYNLTDLTDLSLANNTNLPPWTFPLQLTHSSSLLNYLDLQATNLMGSLPSLSDFFPILMYVYFSNNHLPSSPKVASRTLLLSNNSLTGGLPESFGGSRIAILHLNNQKDEGFSGTIDVLSSMSDLSQVWLQWNSFTGPIPDLSRCASLQDLQLGHNQLTGVVPDSLIALANLNNFSLDYNYLQGPVPEIDPDDFDTVNLGVDTTNGFCHKDPGPCDQRVTILLEIAAEFKYPILLARTWKGNNPCKGWRSITCDDKSKIRMVNLSNLKLTGTISSAFANLTDLRELYLNGNNLTGEIPDGLTSLPQLELVNVSNNHLAGNIPKFSTKVKVFTAGNDFLQLPSNGSSDHRRPSRISTPLITATIAAAAGIGGLVLLVIVICNRKRCLSFLQRIMSKETGPFVDNEFEEFMKSYGSLMLRRYNYSEVKRMTNSFQDKLGRGGYGIVYKACLSDGCPVAVKVLTESSASGEEFINEVASISKTSHVNIVSLLGFCYEKHKRALIYEFMSNGSLDKFIYKQESPNNAFCSLDWNTLFQITIGIARGLEYLHQGCSTRILHLDIKPQNILLDEDFCPKIADFGLAKIYKKKESIVSFLGTRGTPGYIAPEVFSRTFGKVSHKSDVYSFGMLILELVGGRKNYDTGESLTSEMYFPDWIYKDLEEQNMLGRDLATTEEENDMIKKITLPVLYAPKVSVSQFSRISYSITDEEDYEIVEEFVSIK